MDRNRLEEVENLLNPEGRLHGRDLVTGNKQIAHVEVYDADTGQPRRQWAASTLGLTDVLCGPSGIVAAPNDSEAVGGAATPATVKWPTAVLQLPVAPATSTTLADGATRCMLFTDLANPTSNKIYAEVGYRRCGDWEEIALAPCLAGHNTCLYIGDIADNREKRKSVRLYAVSEPRPPEKIPWDDTLRTAPAHDAVRG